MIDFMELRRETTRFLRDAQYLPTAARWGRGGEDRRAEPTSHHAGGGSSPGPHPHPCWDARELQGLTL